MQAPLSTWSVLGYAAHSVRDRVALDLWRVQIRLQTLKPTLDRILSSHGI